MAEQKITSNTLIPVGIVGAVILVIVAASIWFTELFVTAKANAADIKVLQEKTSDSNKRLSRIEGKLDVIIKRLPRK